MKPASLMVVTTFLSCSGCCSLSDYFGKDESFPSREESPGATKTGKSPGAEETGEESAGKVDEDDVIRFVKDEWLGPQQEGDAVQYAVALADDFEGVTEMSTGEKHTLDKDDWIERRAKAFKAKPEIEISDIRVDNEGAPDRIEVVFTQKWESKVYCDTGEKKLAIRQSSSGLEVFEEEMLSVSECPWASASTFFSFIRKYKRAWNQKDVEYLEAHTCLPMETLEILDDKGYQDVDRRKVKRLSQFLQGDYPPHAWLVPIRISNTKNYKVLGETGCKYVSAAKLKGDNAFVEIKQVKCGYDDVHEFTFVFKEDRWMFCNYLRTWEAP